MTRRWTVLVNQAAGATPTRPGMVAEVLRGLGVEHDILTPANADESRALVRESIAEGRTDIAVFRPSDGTWYIVNSSNSSYTIQQFGQSGDRPTQSAFAY